MDAKGQVRKDFATCWMSLLNRKSAKAIMSQRISTDRMISKLLANFIDEDYGQLYGKYYDEKKKAENLEAKVRIP